MQKKKGWQRPGYVKNTSGSGRVRKGMKEACVTREAAHLTSRAGKTLPSIP